MIGPSPLPKNVAAPVFFTPHRYRARLLAAALGGSLVLVIGLGLLAALSLLRRQEVAPHTKSLGSEPAAPQAEGTQKPLALVIEGGPNPHTTPQILEALAREKILATFVPSGHRALDELGLVERIFAEGHQLAHLQQPSRLNSEANLRQHIEARSTLRIVEAVTGHSTLIEVVPGLAAYGRLVPQPVAQLVAKGAVLVTSAEGEAAKLSTLTKPSHRASPPAQGFVLSLNERDAPGLSARLPRLVSALRARGYTFQTLPDVLGKERDELMPRIHSDLDRWMAHGNRLTLALVKEGRRLDRFRPILTWTFATVSFLALLRTVIMMALALLQHRRNLRLKAKGAPNPTGKVSIIIPAYNEVLAIRSVIEQALKGSHKDLEVIVVDDGSTDGTFDTAQAAFGSHPNVCVLRKHNGGKASALNAGLRVATGQFIVCMDGDTLLLEEAVAELLHKFCDPQVGAVSGCVKVARPGNLLTRWQEVEYAIGQNLDRQALEMINGINTVPGAVGAFRREVLAQVGGYHGDTLAEDTDLTLRIIQAGYRVAYAPKAVALTEAPESARQLIKQRFRWSYGAMQTLWKHRSAFANRQCPGLGWFTLPQVFLFQMLVPFLIPIGDIMMLANFTAMVEAPVLSSGLAFVGLEIGAAWVALLLAGERRRLPYLTLVLLTQRLGYRYFTFIPLVKSYVAATNGRAVGWGYLERLGKVVQQPAA